MRTHAWRRICFGLVVVVLLSLVLVPAASASAPAAPATSTSAGGTCYYRVAWGDNLTRIARRFGVSVWQLMVWNGIRNQDRVYAGTVLRVCPPAPPPKPAPRPAPCPAPCAPPPPPPCQNPCQPACSAPAAGPWNGEYFNNQDLGGGPAFVRQDSAINFNWGWGSPSQQQVCYDHFSVRWTGRFNFVCSANYRFTAVTDDGVRIWVDGNLIMDEWREQSVRTFSRDLWLGAGGHDVKVEYFEQAGLAEIHVGWAKLP
jgi:LysM repeat protein